MSNYRYVTQGKCRSCGATADFIFGDFGCESADFCEGENCGAASVYIEPVEGAPIHHDNLNARVS